MIGCLVGVGWGGVGWWEVVWGWVGVARIGIVSPWASVMRGGEF